MATSAATSRSSAIVSAMRGRGAAVLVGFGVALGVARVVLGVGEAGGKRKFFQFQHEVSIPLVIRGKNLRAGKQRLTAELRIDSNGGKMPVQVSVEVPVVPFKEGVLAGS